MLQITEVKEAELSNGTLEKYVKDFLYYPSVKNCEKILDFFITNRLFNLYFTTGQYFLKFFPYDIDFLVKYIQNIDQSEVVLKLCDYILSQNVPENVANKILVIQSKHINISRNKYTQYNKEKVEKITEMLNQTKQPFVAVTMTSCKRYDLFEKTVNSFINCCTDINLISDWMCIDDNSSDDDRKKMKEMYPFINFYFKNVDEKGHPRSMNIIRNMAINNNIPYIFHLEDDFEFIFEKNYITSCLEILNEDEKIGQCLLNKNYAEIPEHIERCKGGDFRLTKNKHRYYIHEYANTDELLKLWIDKHGINGTHCNYWPHFSFRPSLIKTEIFKKIGEFDDSASHFEMDYSFRFVDSKFVSAFLEGIYCIHIGRLTSERFNDEKKNAYDLNNEIQFSEKKLKYRIVCINLDRRLDRMKKFSDNAKNQQLYFERFSAYDGNTLKSTPQLQRIFDGNDYNMRSGMVGCALSHIQLYIDLIYSNQDAYLILEDDIILTNNFKQKLNHIFNLLKNKTEWDLIYLGHHSRMKNTDDYNMEIFPDITKYTSSASLAFSLGGTGGYLISKRGANKLLEFINNHGMTNGIDTMQQKAADVINVYYATPHLIFSECYRGNNTIDTDIQYNYNFLQKSINEVLEDELLFYSTREPLIEVDKDTIFKYCRDNFTASFKNIYHRNKKEDITIISHICKTNNIPFYTIGNEVIIITCDKYPNRYYNRLKKGDSDIYSIEDAVKFK